MKKLIAIIAMALVSCAVVMPVQAQVNPFSRKPIEPKPEPEPAPSALPRATTILPPAQEAARARPTILDYESELNALQLIGLRNDRVVIRAPQNIFFLRDGEKFNYNGAIYRVGVRGDTFRLFLADEEPEMPIAEGQKPAKKEKPEPIEVFQRRIGRSINLSAL